MRFFALDNEVAAIREGTSWQSGLVVHDGKQKLGLTVTGTDGEQLGVQLTPNQALDLARYLFLTGVRLLAKSANGRTAAGVAARMVIRQTKELQDECAR